MTSYMGDGNSAPRSEYDLSNPVRSFGQTTARIVKDPAGFFRGLDVSGQASLYGALAFALICSVITAPLVFLATPFDPLSGENIQNPLSWIGELGAGGVVGVIPLGVIFVPILAILGLYIGAGIYHLFVMLFVGSERNSFDATFKAYAYSSVVLLVAWIPILGFLATLYGIYLTFVGIRETHSTSTNRAAAVVAIPLALTLIPFVFGVVSTVASVV